MTEAVAMKMEVQHMALDGKAIAIPEKVLSQDTGGEMVLLDLEKGGYYGLNEVGSRVWSRLQQGLNMGEVLSTVLTEYDVPEDRLRSDVREFLLQLQAEGLIEVHEKQDS